MPKMPARPRRPAELLWRRRQFLELLAGSTLALSCGGAKKAPSGLGPPEPPQGSSPGAGTPGAAVSLAARNGVLAALEAKLLEVADPLTGAIDAAPLLAWLGQRPEFMQIGYSPDRCPWAIFTDGRRLIVGNDSRIRPAPLGNAPPPGLGLGLGSGATAPLAAVARAPQAAAGAESGIPLPRFRYLNCWDALPDMPLQGVTSSIQNDYQLDGIPALMEELGYQVMRSTDRAILEEVEALRSVGGEGVFFWATHGGSLQPGASAVEYALWTRTPATKESVEVDYAADFGEGRLTYYVAPSCLDGLRCDKGSRYEPASRLAITPKFITDYRWSFADYGFAYVAACLSAQPPFRDAFLAAGASVYAGWEKSVRVPYLCAAARDLFELMLGTNDLCGPDGAPLNTEPFLRPFAYGPAASYLQKRGVASYADPQDGQVSMAFAMNTARPLAFQTLRPSIFRMGVNEGNGELELIGGQFGATPGRVVVGPSVRQPTGTEVAPRADLPVEGGQELTVVSWASDGIRCKLPLTGPAASGYVQVWVDSRWSNVAQLTSWVWRLTLTSSGPGTLQQRASLEVLVRADLRAMRTEVDGEPVHAPLVPFIAAKGLSASYSASGTHSGPSAGCARTVSWDAAGALAPDLGPSTLLGFLDPKLRQLQFGLGLSVPGALRVTDTSVCNGTTTVAERLDTLALANWDSHAVVPLPPYLAVQLDEAYGIPPGAFEYVLNRLVISGGEVSTVRVQWDAAPASFPPELRNGGR